ncbi:MAG: divalent-cation tolerance protein CutA [Desulfurella sp.]|uniref:divalent-cation tolerance protein CutA n=1 Tax=Desulfurella sp. TaxID=1962857 RepID=UPI000CA8999D|nr:divalent-cation tolerance protein CutA [Desulfurella sp.]PMP91682.1 MAG: hypothetical protein C0173_03090 [Desulfurella sp.]HEX13319.1 divalent-cation tolerance protein CutA [Desulfurella acetivorans]
MSDFVIILTTSDKKETLERIANYLVEQRLAACCQIIGLIESFYIYEGKFEHTDEYLCIIKTHSSLYNKVESAIKLLHNYKTPEIVEIDIQKLNLDYLKWMKEILNI